MVEERDVVCVLPKWIVAHLWAEMATVEVGVEERLPLGVMSQHHG